MTRIWVDADACPVVIKEILYRAAERVQVELTLVANAPLRPPRSPFIKSLLVPGGFDVADERILALVGAGDLVITADIPLASAVIDKGAQALNPRGELYTRDTVRQKLTMRDFMDQLRASGVHTGGPPPISPADRKAFADRLDQWLARRVST
jgi:hypothetical protein